MDLPTEMDSVNMKCQYTVIVSSYGEHSITTLQSSQIIITNTAMEWAHLSIRDVNIHASFINQLSMHLYIGLSAIPVWIGVELSEEYTHAYDSHISYLVVSAVAKNKTNSGIFMMDSPAYLDAFCGNQKMHAIFMMDSVAYFMAFGFIKSLRPL